VIRTKWSDMPAGKIDELRKRLDALELKGKSVVPFRGLPIMERAFFPGGNGLLLGRSAVVPNGGTLVLGSNFGCVQDFVNADGTLKRQDETGASYESKATATWKGIRRVFPSSSIIDLELCFFTNAWPFLHEGKSNLTHGLMQSWLKDRLLMQTCLSFFEETLLMTRPKLILALGTGVPAFLAHFWPSECAAWRQQSIAGMDKLPIAKETKFISERIICTAITHPSDARNSNRRLSPYNGEAGERRLLTEAALLANLEP